MAYVGLRTGLFSALAESGPVTATALAERAGLHLRYVEEWLNGMTAAQWLEHDEETGTFTLPDEHTFLLDSEGTDHYMGGLFLACHSLTKLAPQIVDVFRNGGGIGDGVALKRECLPRRHLTGLLLHGVFPSGGSGPPFAVCGAIPAARARCLTSAKLKTLSGMSLNVTSKILFGT